MNALEVIITLTLAIEAGLTIALLYRLRNPSDPEPAYPHFTVREKKFYRSRQRTDGTWEIR
jgi:hypothetical protein